MEGVWRHGIFVGFAAALAALICWPSRTTRTMITYGIPYIVGIMMALVFVDHSIVETD